MRQEVKEIVIPKASMDNVKKTLSTSRLETVAFLFGRVKDKRTVVTDVLIPDEKDYNKRSLCHVDVSEEYVLEKFAKIEKQGKTLLATVHSHPIDELSLGDAMTHMKVIRCYPHQLSGIFNNGTIRFYRYEDGIKETPCRVMGLERFDRQIRLFGEEGQLLISTTIVALIGVGGGNSKIAFDLAGLGIGKLILVDPDKWEETNRNRVLIPLDHVGMAKVKSVKEIINRYYPDVEVEAYVAKAEDLPDQAYAKADLLVVGPDRWLTREFGNKLALRLKKTAFFPAAGIREKDGKINEMGGSVQVVIPEQSPCFQCVNDVDSLTAMKEVLNQEVRKRLSQKYGVSLDIEVAPSIVCLNDVIAGLTIWEIIKLITGFDKPTYFQYYDALKSELTTIKVYNNPKCPACGKVEPIDDDRVKELTISDEDALSSVESVRDSEAETDV